MEKMIADYAESNLIGLLLRNGKRVGEAIDIVQVDDFSSPLYRAVYEAMVKLYQDNKHIDVVSVNAEMNGSVDIQALTKMAELVIGAGDGLETYARIVAEKATMRKLHTLVDEIKSETERGVNDVEPYLDGVIDRIHGIVDRTTGDASEMIGVISNNTIDKIFSRIGTGISGMQTGFVDLDNAIGGLNPGDLIILAARPSMGKTALALNIAYHIGTNVGPVLFSSLEMSKEQLSTRLVASLSGIECQCLRRAMLIPQEVELVKQVTASMEDCELFVDDRPNIGMGELRREARRIKAVHGLALVVVDYIQLMRPGKADNREREVAQLSRNLKMLAKELNVPVLALSQLNRSCETREDKRPKLSDLRESGAIEQDADVILFIYRDEVYNRSGTKGVAEIGIGKQRNGPIGIINLAFHTPTTTFKNYTTKNEPGHGEILNY